MPIVSKKDLKADQVNAVDSALDFVMDKKKQGLHLIEGPAGTGKSTVSSTIISELPKELRERTVVCGPTNKSVKVARQLSGGLTDCMTIYSLLGLSLQANGEVKEIKQRVGGRQISRLQKISLILLDEIGMLGSKIEPYIQEAQDVYGIKILGAGDRYQLPPVGEALSWTFAKANYCVKLTEVKRHDNAILNFATHLREIMDAGSMRIKVKDSFDSEKGGVEVFSNPRYFDQAIADCWNKNKDSGTSDIRVLGWRNKSVENYNEMIRETIYGRAAAKAAKFSIGERIVVCNPILSLMSGEEEKVLMHTDEEAEIESLEEAQHPMFNDIECYKMVVRRDENLGRCGLYTPTERGWKDAQRALDNFKQKALREGSYWAAFWNFNERMNDVRPCHSLTCHRSQGSTFTEVFVDADDVLCNSQALEALKCLYVAATRPSFKLNIKLRG